jgi:hypothetical protein
LSKSADLDAWIAALDARHRASMSTSEYLKAVRALSARYVERRRALSTTSALDSAGKRAAFAAYYAPLHFITTRLIVRSLGAPATEVDRVVDLGCGTGAAGVAWAVECAGALRVEGVDASGWAVGEAAWTYRQWHVSGRARRGDLVRAATALATDRRGLSRTAVLLAWAVNELDAPARGALLPALARLADAGARVLVIEPIARAMSPWWDEWCAQLHGAVSVSDEWKFETPLPPALAIVDEAAGFDRTHLSARSLFVRTRYDRVP